MKEIWVDTQTGAQLVKLPQQMIDYLWERIDIAKKKKINKKQDLAGNISQSYKLEDPQNLIIQNLFALSHLSRAAHWTYLL